MKLRCFLAAQTWMSTGDLLVSGISKLALVFFCTLIISWIVSGVSNSVLLFVLRVHYPHKIAREVPAKTLDLVFYEEFSLCQPAIDSVWTKWV